MVIANDRRWFPELLSDSEEEGVSLLVAFVELECWRVWTDLREEAREGGILKHSRASDVPLILKSTHGESFLCKTAGTGLGI